MREKAKIASGLFNFLAIVFICLLLPGERGQAQAAKDESGLPKISIAPDGRSFRQGTLEPFVIFGANYFRPGTGWAPQLWKQFDLEATGKDFKLMKKLGINCVRVFLSYGSFFQEQDKLTEEGLAKFDTFLQLAEEAGIYVHPAGPDFWEGASTWMKGDEYADEYLIAARVRFWSMFAQRYRGRNVIFAYDLQNEPTINWDTPQMLARWRSWLAKKYETEKRMAEAFGTSAQGATFRNIDIPKSENRRGDRRLLDYQLFREDIADEWTRRQVEAIRLADPQALVTMGLIQWSIPSVLPSLHHYSGFRPIRMARLLDFIEIHFYPLAGGLYHYQNADHERLNLAYLESVAGEAAVAGKPLILAEFGAVGGGTLTMQPEVSGTERQQAEFCRKMVLATSGVACGWLTWALYDTPQANDLSQFSGLLRYDGQIKEWGEEFRLLAGRCKSKTFEVHPQSLRLPLPWEDCLTDVTAGQEYLNEYVKRKFQDNPAPTGKP